MRPILHTSARTQKKPPPLEFYRRVLVKNLRQHVGAHGEHKAPGIAVGLVTEQGDLALGLGQREIGKRLGVDRDTLFGIGSVSKLFVGMAMAKAVVDGNLNYTTKANDWLDESLQVDDRITLGHLVTHRSGLPNFPRNIYKRHNTSKKQTLQQVMPAKNYSKANLASCLKQNGCLTSTPPGSDYGYSNLGIGLLSIALQNRFGYKNPNELTRKLITERLNMGRTNMNEPDYLDRYRDDLAQGYRYQGLTFEFDPVPLSEMGVLAGSGELVSTVNDMNRFLRVLTGLESGELKRAAEEMNRPLEATSRDEVKIGYAHQIRRARDGSEIHWKSGATAGYTAIILWQTEPKVGLVVLSNRGKMKALEATGKRLFSLIARQL
ncbi:MAG: serine hydrolase [Candidatus Thiodiazotropha sp.]|jgi:CubicO group peptidase (beta-lactamase class C family)